MHYSPYGQWNTGKWVADAGIWSCGLLMPTEERTFAFFEVVNIDGHLAGSRICFCVPVRKFLGKIN